MKRRVFLKSLGAGAMVVATQTDLWPKMLGGLQEACASGLASKLSSVEASYYHKLPEGGIECGICPRHCHVSNSERGYCGTRENRKDVYYTLVYGLPCALNIDPIEKKPFFHFYPGTDAFSLATAGCNANCHFCQNWDISQSRPEQTRNYHLPPNEVVDTCRDKKVPTIAYTYSEPTIFYEYMYDTAEFGHKSGIKSVMVSNGFIEPKPLTALLGQLDAIKIDLKSIREGYYRNYVGVPLKPVLDNIVRIKKSGVWLELVYLIVPTLNDTEAEFVELAQWTKRELGTDVPLHFSQFRPQYLLRNLPPTPQKTLERAHEIGRAEGLAYVYLGNIPGHPAESTYCPGCGRVVIERRGYAIYKNNLKGNHCGFCNREIPGRFSS